MAQQANPAGSWFQVPQALTVTGPYGYYIDKICRVFLCSKAVLSDSLEWLKEPSGQKNLLIKFPDAIVRISKRLYSVNPPISISGKILWDVANFLRPLHALGGCAKPFLAIVELGTKFKPMFASPRTSIEYVVKDQNNQPRRAHFPVGIWEQRAEKLENIFLWTISLCEVESYLRKSLENKAAPLMTPFAVWGSPYLSLKSLYCEGWFLYKTWWLGDHLLVNNPAATRTTLAKEEIVGSLLKISLSAVCLSLDIFNKLAAKENKPFWLETAMFWTGIAPTLLTPVAMRYWPKLVTRPLHVRAT